MSSHLTDEIPDTRKLARELIAKREAKRVMLPGLKTIDMAGETYHRWTILAFAGTRRGLARWLCECTCGAIKNRDGAPLRAGKSKSCGCLKIDFCKERFSGHGLTKTPEYASWAHMRGRCLNPSNPKYPSYGGRGIQVCQRWQSFENFLADMGPRPGTDYSIERVNNNGNYEPENCKWATRIEQANNRRTNHLITINGKTHSAAEWERIYRLPEKTVVSRTQQGWKPEDVIRPVGWRPSLIAITHEGVTRPIGQWAKSLGIRYNLIFDRLKKGWPPDECLFGRQKGGERIQ